MSENWKSSWHEHFKYSKRNSPVYMLHALANLSDSSALIPDSLLLYLCKSVDPDESRDIFILSNGRSWEQISPLEKYPLSEFVLSWLIYRENYFLFKIIYILKE